MKAFIQKIFKCLKSLFLRLRVIVTLQFGREEVDNTDPDKEESGSATNRTEGGSDNDPESD